MGLFPSMESLPKGDDSERVFPQFNTVEYTVKTFTNKLKQINGMSDEEVRDVICRQYETFLNYDLFLHDAETRKVACEMFTNKKFLRNLIECIQDNSIQMNEHRITCCNKLAYDYIASHQNGNSDPEVVELLKDLSFIVNMKTVLDLTNIIGIEPAKTLAMFRNSSFRVNVNIARVNKFLIESGLQVTETEIYNIYYKLYPKITDLFCETMLELPETYYTKEERYRYDEISKALVDILDNMQSDDIRRVLENYISVYEFKGKPTVRFTMKGIQYPRISSVIEDLEFEEGVDIP